MALTSMQVGWISFKLQSCSLGVCSKTSACALTYMALVGTCAFPGAWVGLGLVVLSLVALGLAMLGLVALGLVALGLVTLGHY